MILDTPRLHNNGGCHPEVEAGADAMAGTKDLVVLGTLLKKAIPGIGRSFTSFSMTVALVVKRQVLKFEQGSVLSYPPMQAFYAAWNRNVVVVDTLYAAIAQQRQLSS